MVLLPGAFALKVPLALFALLGWAAFECARSKCRDSAVFLLLPALTIFSFMTFISNAQIGVCYLLPVLPLLHVFVGGLLARSAVASSRLRLVTLVGLVTWYVGSAVSFHPHYLGYVNEPIGDRKNLYRYLADSNVDWGQNGRHLDRYLERNPGARISVEPETPVTGTVVVRVNPLVGLGGSFRTVPLASRSP